MPAFMDLWKSAKGALTPDEHDKSASHVRRSSESAAANNKKLSEKWSLKGRSRLSNGEEPKRLSPPEQMRVSSRVPVKSSSFSSEHRITTDLLQGKNGPPRRSSACVESSPSSPKRSSVGTPDSYIGIPDFTIQGSAGEGSFGTVLKAVWRENGKVVALKQLKPMEDFVSLVPEKELRSVYRNIYDAFKREIKFLEQAKHPNVIGLLGKSKDSMLCALEIACCDLFQLVRSARKTLPLAIAHTVAVGLLEGVSHLHDIGIIHQDIKSSNVLLDEHGRAKLCDFGLAIAARGEVKVDREIITLWYRAPELLMGCASYDAAVDDWAVGCVLLEMLVGGVAFPGDPAQACTCDNHRHLNFNRDQLGRIFKVVGTPAPLDPKTYACHAHFASWPACASRLSQLIADSCRSRGSKQTRRDGPAALSGPESDNLKCSVAEWTAVVEELLSALPSQRATCADALSFPLFRQRRTSPARLLPLPSRAASDSLPLASSPPRSSPLSPSRRISSCSSSSKAERRDSVKPPPQNAQELLRHLCQCGADEGGPGERFQVGSGRLPSLSCGAEEGELNRSVDSGSRGRRAR